MCAWGNNRRCALGIGFDDPELYVRTPEVIPVRGVDGLPWFIPKTHEYWGGCITLKGEIWLWGESPPFQDMDDEECTRLTVEPAEGRAGKPCFPKPAVCRSLQKLFADRDELPICLVSGHDNAAVLTNRGHVYVSRRDCGNLEVLYHGESPICMIGMTSFAIITLDTGGRLCASDFCIKTEIDEEPLLLDYAELLLEDTPEEKVVRLDCSYYKVYLTTNRGCLLSQKVRALGRFFGGDPGSRSMKKHQLPGKVVAVTGASSHSMVCLENGDVMSIGGRDGYGEATGFLDPSRLHSSKSWERFESPIRFVSVSNGANYSGGGFSLLLSEENRLYHCGCNRNGEGLQRPDGQPHRLRKLDSLAFEGRVIGMFQANENYCTVLTFRDVVPESEDERIEGEK